MIATLALALAPSFLPLSDEDHPDYAALGQGFLKERLHAASAADAPADKLLADHCARLQLGLFDIAYPAWALSQKGGVEDLRALAGALLDTERTWIEWLAKGEPATAAPLADIETLKAWLKTWKPAALAKVESATDKSLFTLFAASEAQKTAAEHLRDTLCHPDALGLAPKNGAPLSILFAPTRRDFVELLGYTGLVDSTQQAQLWTADATMWTTFWLEWNFVVALEYPPWVYDKEFKTCMPMNKFEPTGKLEHAVQQATLALLWMYYGDNDALHLQQAMAMNMAIEVCGSCNALEGDGGRGTTGARTQPYEKFVPGGDPNGGTLPAIPAAPFDGVAKNQWHEGMGKDHYAKALRNGQKQAQKQMLHEKPADLDPIVAKDKDAHFLLVSEDMTSKGLVCAPFFGKAAGDKAYPSQDIIADYKEFFRAYRSGFAWYLETMGDKAGAAPSAVKWKQLMKALAARDESKTFEDVVLEIYGVPLSSKNGSVDSLEWRYLGWLAKGK
ncbi:MAG: hypothetical protein IPJ19_13285 [Planctomycetes bacterium]|nr:hypothetical protein [Planctomycetota bacterium]